MFFLKKFLIAWVLPPAGLLLLALAGFILARRKPRLGRTLVVLAWGSLLLLSLPRVAGGLMSTLQWHAPLDTDRLISAQAIVVLGGGNYPKAPEYGGDTIGFVSLERLRYAVYLSKRSGLPLLATGGAPGGGVAEADTMAAVAAKEFSVPVRWIERESFDTAESARYSAALLKSAGISHVALVTHAWHLPRAVAQFESAGLIVEPAPMGFSQVENNLMAFLPQASALAGSTRALQEWLGLFVYSIVASHPAASN